LRGLYVGIISRSPIHGGTSLEDEQGKIDRGLGRGQPEQARVAQPEPLARARIEHEFECPSLRSAPL
jgi:hypothetical protein